MGLVLGSKLAVCLIQLLPCNGEWSSVLWQEFKHSAVVSVGLIPCQLLSHSLIDFGLNSLSAWQIEGKVSLTESCLLLTLWCQVAMGLVWLFYGPSTIINSLWEGFGEPQPSFWWHVHIMAGTLLSLLLSALAQKLKPVRGRGE